MLFAVPVGLFHLKLRWKSDYARRRLFGFLRHCIILYSFLILLWYCVGWQSLFYLITSRLFFTGFAGHPLLAYWITVHQSHRQTKTTCQPTTSIYDPLVAFLTSNECFHVEHHDFPTV